MSLNYVIWNVSPRIIDLGKFEIRYYSLLFALGFVLGYIILLQIFKKQGRPVEFLDRLTIYMVISTIIGARLGHCLFYEFNYYIQHPLEIILPWRGTIGEDFEFTGFQGLASHGAAIGILIGLYLFARKTKSSFLWVLDMIVIVTALAGSFIRLGNLMNSEIYGKPTESNFGFIYTRDFTDLLESKYVNILDKVYFSKPDQYGKWDQNGVPVRINMKFDRQIKNEDAVKPLGENLLKEDLSMYNFDNNVFLPKGDSLNYVIEHSGNQIVLKADIGGTPRHPSQIYESVSYFLIFIFLMGLYLSLKKRLKDGFIFGFFLTLVFIARFFIEFIKENQEIFENNMALNMGQLLSIPFVITGLVLIVWKWPMKKADYETQPPS